MCEVAGVACRCSFSHVMFPCHVESKHRGEHLEYQARAHWRNAEADGSDTRFVTEMHLWQTANSQFVQRLLCNMLAKPLNHRNASRCVNHSHKQTFRVDIEIAKQATWQPLAMETLFYQARISFSCCYLHFSFAFQFDFSHAAHGMFFFGFLFGFFSRACIRPLPPSEVSGWWGRATSMPAISWLSRSSTRTAILSLCA